MRFTTSGRRWLVLLAAVLLLFTIPARGAITPESDVVLPWFGIDLTRDDGGLSTRFNVVNGSPETIQAMATVYSNWGIPVLEVPLTFKPDEAMTLAIHEWIIHGLLPDGSSLSENDLADLQAKLTGRPSIADGLYYGTSYEGHSPNIKAVNHEIAVGYVIVRALGDRPDVLWGDTHSIDATSNYFHAETLNALTHDLKADCNHHAIRFDNDGLLYEGDELIVWSGRSFSPSKSTTPVGTPMKMWVKVYDQNGNLVHNCYKELISLEVILLCHELQIPIGWLEIITEDPTFINAHLHSLSDATAQLHSYCLRQDAGAEGPSIKLDKMIDNQPADRPPGPQYDLNSPMEFEFIVTNTGSEVLTDIVVTDDPPMDITCPKTTLQPGESMTCTAQGIALGCTNGDFATATGTTPNGAKVTDTDVAYYHADYHPAVTLELLVNGDEADDPEGPLVKEDDPLSWTFVVTNTGDSSLTGLVVTWRNGQPATCPKSELAPGESMTCTLQSLAQPGQRREVGEVTGSDPCGAEARASDPAHYKGKPTRPGIEIKKFVGESDANVPPGPTIPVGTAIEWRFLVTNIGNETLNDIVVNDNGVTPTCPKTTLGPGESMICTATSVALPCQHTNIASASSTAESGKKVTSNEDPANYYGQGAPALTLEMRVNGDAADTPTGPTFKVGDLLQFTFEVANTGNVALKDIVVSDDLDHVATCPKNTLEPGESMSCLASMLATEGCQERIGTATAKDPCDQPAEASDPAFYCGQQQKPAIEIVKLTNGEHYTAAPGARVPIGQTVQWSYVVTNIGNVALTGISVTDDQGVAVTCPKTALEPGESMTCTASGFALPCQYTNIATATGQPPEGNAVSDNDDSFYYGTFKAAITIDKKTNGEDAAEAPGPQVTVGSTVSWTYLVTNTGEVALTNVTVTDDRITPVTCPKTTLDPGESMTCTASGTALAGQQRNVGKAEGTPPCGNAVSDDDASHYFGVGPGITIKKLIDGEDADDPNSAVKLLVGSQVIWSFVVTNIGDVVLNDVEVTDSDISAITCPKNTLDPGESMTCTASAIITLGNHCDTGKAKGTSPQDVGVEDTDTACYDGFEPAITIKKYTNTVDADTPPGPTVAVGSTVYWTYVVTNTGSTTLTNVSVTDDKGVTVTCPKTTLAAGESMTCTASGAATMGQYANIGTVTGKPPAGGNVTASDPSHYVGAGPGITIKKLIDGEDANDPASAVKLRVGSQVTWSFIVTNTGNVVLSNIAVTDSDITGITCPKTGLAPAESMTCTATAVITLGNHCDTGKATGLSPQEKSVEDTDTACYEGYEPAITIVKKTNGEDANSPPGPTVIVGSAVQWTYVVTNTGPVTLTNVSVTDDRGVTVTCPKTTLAAGESMTCTASGTAAAGQYANIGTVTGKPPTGSNVTASDPSHYFGQTPGSQGCTPGYWKNHTDSWAAAGYSPSQTILSVFSESWRHPALAGSTLHEALGFGGGAGVEGAAEILLRAAVAALLNGAHPGVDYPRYASDVIANVNTALASGNRDTMLSLAAALDADNNLGCPLN